MPSSSFNGDIYAVMKDGVATSVIFIDADAYAASNKVDGKPSVSSDITVTIGMDKVTYTVKTGATVTAVDLASAIEAKMNEAGYTQVTVDMSTKKVTAEMSGKTVILTIEKA